MQKYKKSPNKNNLKTQIDPFINFIYFLFLNDHKI